jgi:hypothetical protein
MTNYGLRIALPLIEIPNYPGYYRAFLACSILGLEKQAVKATEVKTPASNSRIKPLADLEPAPVHQRLEATLSTIFLSQSTEGPDSTFFRVQIKGNWTDTWIGILDKPNNKEASETPESTAITSFIFASRRFVPSAARLLRPPTIGVRTSSWPPNAGGHLPYIRPGQDASGNLHCQRRCLG